ncbi:MAG: thymidylate kinase [Candidatus Kapaibacterium sp.]|nr:MAG: thymidylate kinase [Candidatus Kapabacteria bacterium]
MFITFEGIDGSGKSTHAGLLAEWLRARGHRVELLREPGATPLAEAIRQILLDATLRIDPVAELMLFCAARRQLVEDVIRPALAQGQVVISDRYADSTVAYQGYGRGLDLEMVERIIGYAIGSVVPHVTFVLDVDVATALQRRGVRQSRTTDRMEDAPEAFFERVRRGYLAIAAREPERVVVLDGMQSVEMIHSRVCAVVLERLRQIHRGALT